MGSDVSAEEGREKRLCYELSQGSFGKASTGISGAASCRAVVHFKVRRQSK